MPKYLALINFNRQLQFCARVICWFLIYPSCFELTWFFCVGKFWKRECLTLGQVLGPMWQLRASTWPMTCPSCTRPPSRRSALSPSTSTPTSLTLMHQGSWWREGIFMVLQQRKERNFTAVLAIKKHSLKIPGVGRDSWGADPSVSHEEVNKFHLSLPWDPRGTTRAGHEGGSNPQERDSKGIS